MLFNSGLIGSLFLVLGFMIRKWMRDTEEDVKEVEIHLNEYKRETETNTAKAVTKVIEDFSKITENLEDLTNGMNKNIQSMEKLIAVLEVTIKTQFDATSKELGAAIAWLEETEQVIRAHSEKITRIEAYCNTCPNRNVKDDRKNRSYRKAGIK